MAPRGLAAVLLLFAVLGMHGLQCGSVADGADHDTSTAVMAVAMTASAAGDVHLIDAASTHTAPPPAGDDAMPAAVVGGGHDSAPVHGATHLWAACLAVLAAGLAVLLACILPRRVALAPASLIRAIHRALGSLPVPRPPDLHALCLLRT